MLSSERLSGRTADFDLPNRAAKSQVYSCDLAFNRMLGIGLLGARSCRPRNRELSRNERDGVFGDRHPAFLSAGRFNRRMTDPALGSNLGCRGGAA